MSKTKEDILSNGNKKSILNFLDRSNEFTMEDYKIIVTNTKITNFDFYVYLIKFKFHIVPNINVLVVAHHNWLPNLIVIIFILIYLMIL